MAHGAPFPTDWRKRMEKYDGRVTKLGVGRFFGVGGAVVERWSHIDEDFAELFNVAEPLAMNHESHIRDRLDDLIACHDSRMVKSFQILLPDLVIVLKDVRLRIAKLEGEKRMLASEINRLKHATHLRNSRGSIQHKSGSIRQKSIKPADPAPDA